MNESSACVECAMNQIVPDIVDNEVVILISGDQSMIDESSDVFHLMED